jgi:hypothetical protein
MDKVIGDRTPDELSGSSLMESVHFEPEIEVPGSILMESFHFGVDKDVDAKDPGSILIESLLHVRPDVVKRGRTRPVEDGTTNAEVVVDVVVDVRAILLPRVRAS